MEWGNEPDVGVQSGDEESDDVGVESGDEDGPTIGQGVWVGNRWHDLLDPHPDPDYELEPHQVMNTQLITTKHTIHF